jgi:NADP-dependent 3-hydroxy acid dehydrogenase YdfG
MDGSTTRTAIVTGASSGIGAATAVRLAREGFDVVLGASRVDKLEEVAKQCGGRALELDVTEPDSIADFVDRVETADVLVNNAGLALGLSPLDSIPDEELEVMWETNVLGLVRMTRAFIPKLEASGNGHIVNLGSTASYETYPGGGGYTASKHAVKALSHTMRLDLLGRPIRVTLVSPGLVETEFSVVRFRGDEDKAKKPYEGMQPLVAEDIADCVAWAVTRPPHVNIDEIVLRPLAQATSTTVARKS